VLRRDHPTSDRELRRAGVAAVEGEGRDEDDDRSVPSVVLQQHRFRNEESAASGAGKVRPAAGCRGAEEREDGVGAPDYRTEAESRTGGQTRCGNSTRRRKEAHRRNSVLDEDQPATKGTRIGDGDFDTTNRSVSDATGGNHRPKEVEFVLLFFIKSFMVY
jgi:hypothetical protein